MWDKGVGQFTRYIRRANGGPVSLPQEFPQDYQTVTEQLPFLIEQGREAEHIGVVLKALGGVVGTVFAVVDSGTDGAAADAEDAEAVACCAVVVGVPRCASAAIDVCVSLCSV